MGSRESVPSREGESDTKLRYRVIRETYKNMAVADEPGGARNVVGVHTGTSVVKRGTTGEALEEIAQWDAAHLRLREIIDEFNPDDTFEESYELQFKDPRSGKWQTVKSLYPEKIFPGDERHPDFGRP